MKFKQDRNDLEDEINYHQYLMYGDSDDESDNGWERALEESTRSWLEQEMPAESLPLTKLVATPTRDLDMDTEVFFEDGWPLPGHP